MLLVAQNGLSIFSEEIFEIEETASFLGPLILDKILLAKQISRFSAFTKQLKLL